MADINSNDSAILADDLEIDSYDDVVKLLGTDDAASMLADVVGNRFNRQDVLKAILNGEDIYLDYWPDYKEFDYAARICGELLADTSLAWADGLIDSDKIETHKGLTTADLSHAVTCVLTDRFTTVSMRRDLRIARISPMISPGQSNRGSARDVSGASSTSTAIASATT